MRFDPQPSIRSSRHYKRTFPHPIPHILLSNRHRKSRHQSPPSNVLHHRHLPQINPRHARLSHLVGQRALGRQFSQESIAQKEAAEPTVFYSREQFFSISFVGPIHHRNGAVFFEVDYGRLCQGKGHNAQR